MVWDTLRRLGHRGDEDHICQAVFETASHVVIPLPDGGVLNGDELLVSVFEGLGSTKDWPACGTSDWARLRQVASGKVVARLACEGLLDCVAVSPVADDGDEVKAAENDSTDPRQDVQIFRAMIRRGERNPVGWFKAVEKNTPYRVIARWAVGACPDVSRENLVALLDSLNEVRFWEDDGHIRGGELLQALEAELEDGCESKEWMLSVSDFEAAIQRLRSVFEKLCLL